MIRRRVHELVAQLDTSDEVVAAMADGWVIDELIYVWRAAHVEAVLAYHAWQHTPGKRPYTVYRAAQDRADAAQDALAAILRCRRAVVCP